MTMASLRYHDKWTNAVDTIARARLPELGGPADGTSTLHLVVHRQNAPSPIDRNAIIVAQILSYGGANQQNSTKHTPSPAENNALIAETQHRGIPHLAYEIKPSALRIQLARARPRCALFPASARKTDLDGRARYARLTSLPAARCSRRCSIRRLFIASFLTSSREATESSGRDPPPPPPTPAP